MKIVVKIFAFFFRFEIENFEVYRVKATGLKVYKRDRRDNPVFETYIGKRYVLRQK